MRDRIRINGYTYRLMRGKGGGREWTVRQRPSQRGDPGDLHVAEWRIDTPNLHSIEDLSEGETGFLGIDYCDDTDSRWHNTLCLGPAITTLDLSGNDSGDTVEDARGLDLATSGDGTLFMYIIRGTRVAKVRVSTLAHDTATTTQLGAVARSVLTTTQDDDTLEVSFGKSSGAYEVTTTIGNATVNDTHSTSNTQAASILGQAPDRVVALNGQQVLGNILTGSVTMDAPSWNEVANVTGEDITPTGFIMDGDQWVLGTNKGPYMLDSRTKEFFPLMRELALSADTENCRHFAQWFDLGVLLQLRDGARYQVNGSGASWGVETFEGNHSPVNGFPTGTNGGVKWLYQTIYNPRTGVSWLLAWRPHRSGDQHLKIMQPYVIANLGSRRSNLVAYIGTGDGALTNARCVVGYGSDIATFIIGRDVREILDSNYSFKTSGTAFLTEMRRFPGIRKDLEAVEFETDDCDANDTVIMGFSVDDGAYNDLTTITSDGVQRQLFVSSGAPTAWSTGYRIKPRVTMAAGAATGSPKIIGNVRLYYRLRPTTVDEIDAVLVLDEQSPGRSLEDLQDQLATEFGSGAGPVEVQEDPDRDESYYVRVESVEVREAMEPGGGDQATHGPVRVAAVRMIRWPLASTE